MDLKSLKTFHRIVSLGSFNRAAEELNYAQSTVTMQMQKLEAELGITLIERGRTFQLTEAGRLFHEQSAGIVKDMDRLHSRMSDWMLGEAGELRLGAVEPIASSLLPRLLQRFLAAYPKIGIAVDIGNTPLLGERLLRGELDLALCSRPVAGGGLYFEPLYSEELLFLLPEGHPLSALERIRFSDIRDHRILLTSRNCPYRHKIEMLLGEACGSPLNSMEISSMAAMKPYVESGLGIALMPRSLIGPLPPGMLVREVRDARVSVTFGLLCRAADFPLKLAGARLYDDLKRNLGGEGVR
ncbi:MULTISPECIES: LysR family transcriptional regulator [Paenibacillus]|uniref:LysR family transcriptional regulator n=1 Tax=Paenibacillus TaxID=44249 RepID=UPI0022B86D5C|nr:LysR family transcriptional regulator [Paenibacillus caseinilyticus]MCZ8518437.1 LysR family transcriptional regulator [Paenibacillus caseinilyticus]